MINMSDLITPNSKLQNDSDTQSAQREGRVVSGNHSKFSALMNASAHGDDLVDGDGRSEEKGDSTQLLDRNPANNPAKLDTNALEGDGLKEGEHHLKKLREIVRETTDRVLSNNQVRSVEVVLVKESSSLKNQLSDTSILKHAPIIGAASSQRVVPVLSDRVSDQQKVVLHDAVSSSGALGRADGGADVVVKPLQLVEHGGGLSLPISDAASVERGMDVSRFESNDNLTKSKLSDVKPPVVNQAVVGADFSAQVVPLGKDIVETGHLNSERTGAESVVKKHANHTFINNLKNITTEVSEKLELGDKKELRIIVRPSHLGEIKVEIQKGIDGVKMSIVTSSEAVSNLLNQYKSEIMSEASKGLAGFGGGSSFEGSDDGADGFEQPSSSSTLDESSEHSDEDEEVAIARVIVTNEIT